MDEHAFAGSQPPDLTQCVPSGEVGDAERGRLVIRQRIRDGDDEVCKRRQVGTERARAESDNPLPDLDRVNIRAQSGHEADTLAADHGRGTVQSGVYRPWP